MKVCEPYIIGCGGKYMSKTGSPEHEMTLEKKLLELEKEGWKTINLHGKSPDGIAVKNGKIAAVEILKKVRMRLGPSNVKKGKGKTRLKYVGGVTLTNKRSNYDMFDDVIFDFFR